MTLLVCRKPARASANILVEDFNRRGFEATRPRMTVPPRPKKKKDDLGSSVSEALKMTTVGSFVRSSFRAIPRCPLFEISGLTEVSNDSTQQAVHGGSIYVDCDFSPSKKLPALDSKHQSNMSVSLDRETVRRI